MCSVLSFKLNIEPGENNIKITYRVLNINILFYTQQDKLSFVWHHNRNIILPKIHLENISALIKAKNDLQSIFLTLKNQYNW